MYKFKEYFDTFFSKILENEVIRIFSSFSEN